ncbi:MAG TPA: 3-deoxy-D-manno-octulosonic acid transferase [Blastocatellia bacterium]|nr:3-deoxy-D-manno-octulosonic acid transferase [Blastocatellia bacterium]
MHLFYSFALTIAFLALLPYFIYQAIRHGKYASSFKQRLGRLPESVRSDGRRSVWVHAVSVGEFLAAKPLIEALRRELPDWRLVVSTTTLTGQRLALAERHARFDAVFYFPFDWAFAARRSLDHIKPSLVIILETELWPNFLRECRRRAVLTVIANGRISPRSFARYRRVRRFIARALDNVSLLVMQSEADAERARSLGARGGSVRVCGNLKYDLVSASEISDLKSEAAEEIDDLFALSSSPHLIVAGSTAPGEERVLLAALDEARRRRGLTDTRLIIAPRHPERFNEVAGIIAQSGFTFARRSEAARFSGTEITDPRRVDVILLDTIGELASLYRFAAVVFVGGSLVARGGHNIIEPAVYAKPIIVGPHTENFRQIVGDFAEAGAVAQVCAAGEGVTASFTRELIRLLTDPESAKAMGARAREILLKNGGATQCVVQAIKEALGTRRDD